MLDASQAFDRVNYYKLFGELLKSDISPIVLSLLLYMYTSQTLRVKWGHTVSNYFTATDQHCVGSKRHSLQAVELTQWLQTAVQIVSKPPSLRNGSLIHRCFGKPAMRIH